MDKSAWAGFAVDAGIGMPLVRRRVRELSELVRRRANEVAADLSAPGFGVPALGEFARLVQGRADQFASKLI